MPCWPRENDVGYLIPGSVDRIRIGIQDESMAVLTPWPWTWEQRCDGGTIAKWKIGI